MIMMVEKDKYPTQFTIQDIRHRYFGMRNQMIRAWNVICCLRSVHGLDIPDDIWNELEYLLSFDASDRIFMKSVFCKQEAEQDAFKKLRLMVGKKYASMENLAGIVKLLEETDRKVKLDVPSWILEILEK